MPNNYFITGLPKAGKTTLLKKLANELKQKKLKVGGFISPEEKIHGTRTGFKVQDINSGKSARLASIDCDGPRVAKYHVDLRSFESFLKRCMKQPSQYDVIVVDEIGRMEMKSTRFQDCLEKILESSIPLIASLHRDYVEDYKVWGSVITITRTNAGRVYLDLLRNTKGLKAQPKKAKAKKKAAKKKVVQKKKPAKKKLKKKVARKKILKKKAPPREPIPLEPEPFSPPPKPDVEKKKAKKPKKAKAKKKPKKKKGGVMDWLRRTFAS
jgi:nucleoside-triphosphatase